MGTVWASKELWGLLSPWGAVEDYGEPWETVDEDSYSLKVMEVCHCCTPKAGAFSLLLWIVLSCS